MTSAAVAMACVLVAAPAMAGERTVTLHEIDTSSAPRITIHFSAREGNAPLSSLRAENFRLLVDGQEVQLRGTEVRSQDVVPSSIGVVVVFPIAKDYVEEFFGIRTNLAILVRQLRAEDWVGAVAYDNSPRSFQAVRGETSELASAIEATENSEIIEPNLFASFPPALSILKRLEVSERYLVIVSNAEGSVVGDDQEATKLIAKFREMATELGVTPIVIGYTPDGAEELTYSKWLEQLAVGGTYLEATSLEQLPWAMQGAFDALYEADTEWILEGELALAPGAEPLSSGPHEFTLEMVETLSHGTKAEWPMTLEPPKSCACSVSRQARSPLAPVFLCLLCVGAGACLRRRQ